MNKLSNEKVAQVLHDAGAALRVMAAERDSVTEKLAGMVRRRDAEKLAAAMHDKGINLDQQFTALADDLEKAADEGRLPVIQEAVGMVAPDMAFKTASITTDEYQTGAGESDLVRFVLGDVG